MPVSACCPGSACCSGFAHCPVFARKKRHMSRPSPGCSAYVLFSSVCRASANIKKASTVNGGSLSLHLQSHLRHTNICVLCHGRKPSASTRLGFGAATREGFSCYSTRTASQLPRLSVTFPITVLSPSTYLLLFELHYSAVLKRCQQENKKFQTPAIGGSNHLSSGSFLRINSSAIITFRQNCAVKLVLIPGISFNTSRFP